MQTPKRFPTSFYVKLGAACFMIGACMELFMINTGFYGVVTKNEAQAWLESKEEREQRAEVFKQELVRQFKQKGLELPPSLQQKDS